MIPTLGNRIRHTNKYEAHVVLRHPIAGASKNVQIPTVSEFDMVARFCESIPTVKSVS